jgi:hypothetical protein
MAEIIMSLSCQYRKPKSTMKTVSAQSLLSLRADLQSNHLKLLKGSDRYLVLTAWRHLISGCYFISTNTLKRRPKSRLHRHCARRDNMKTIKWLLYIDRREAVFTEDITDSKLCLCDASVIGMEGSQSGMGSARACVLDRPAGLDTETLLVCGHLWTSRPISRAHRTRTQPLHVQVGP